MPGWLPLPSRSTRMSPALIVRHSNGSVRVTFASAKLDRGKPSVEFPLPRSRSSFSQAPRRLRVIARFTGSLIRDAKRTISPARLPSRTSMTPTGSHLRCMCESRRQQQDPSIQLEFAGLSVFAPIFTGAAVVGTIFAHYQIRHGGIRPPSRTRFGGTSRVGDQVQVPLSSSSRTQAVSKLVTKSTFRRPTQGRRRTQQTTWTLGRAACLQ